MWKKDPMSGSDIRLVFTLAPGDITFLVELKAKNSIKFKIDENKRISPW